MGRGRGGGEMEGTTNAQRARWAESALAAYAPFVYGSTLADLTSEDRQTCVTDLLADLIHYSRREGIDFDRCLGLALRHAGYEGKLAWDDPTN
jgi:hypothetical protein